MNTRKGVGLYVQLNTTNLKALILDENGKKITVPYSEFIKYYKPENTEERLRRMALYVESPEAIESIKMMADAIKSCFDTKDK